jgi:hypothetical protein
MNTDSFVNSLQRGLKILEAFTPEPPRLNLQELRSTTGIPKTTVLRLIKTDAKSPKKGVVRNECLSILQGRLEVSRSTISNFDLLLLRRMLIR